MVAAYSIRPALPILKNLKGVTVGQFAREHIKEGSIVESDAYQSYRKPLANRYFHKFDVFNADKDMLKWLHTIVGNAKLFIDGTFHGLGGKYIQSYLDEFTYRFNRWRIYFGFFENLLSASISSKPLTLAVLKGISILMKYDSRSPHGEHGLKVD